MASIICRNGTEHRHSSVPESRACWTLGRNPYAGADKPLVKTPPVVVTEGFWVVQSGFTKEIFKVVSSDAGRLYGKLLGADGFEFFPGAVRRITEGNGRKLTLTEAEEYGKLYGRCMICGRTLTNEGSIARGIGPVCAEKL